MLLVGVLEEVLGHDDALDVVEPVLVNGDAGVFLPDDEVLEAVDGRVLPDADHVDPGRHDLADDGVAEFDDAPEELVLALVDDPLLRGLVDEGLDLLVRGLAPLLPVLPLFLALDEVPGQGQDGGAKGPDERESGEEDLQDGVLAEGVEEAGQVIEEDRIDGEDGQEKPEGPEPEAREKGEEIDEEDEEEDIPEVFDGDPGPVKIATGSRPGSFSPGLRGSG